MDVASIPFWSNFSEMACLGDFNVIRRILEMLGGSRLTPSMRVFDEFKRESELVDPALRNAFSFDQTCKKFPFSKGWIDSYTQMSGTKVSLKVCKKFFLD